MRLGSLTSDFLDTEKDSEHLFANQQTDTGHGLTKDRGVLSFVIVPKDSEHAEAVSYSFQLSKDGDMFVFSEGNVHLEVSNVYIKATDIKLDSDTIVLGNGTTSGVVRASDLISYLQGTFKCMTAWGPSGPLLSPITETDIASDNVVVKK